MMGSLDIAVRLERQPLKRAGYYYKADLRRLEFRMK